MVNAEVWKGLWPLKLEEHKEVSSQFNHNSYILLQLNDMHRAASM
jgi:hypothetical protein